MAAGLWAGCGVQSHYYSVAPISTSTVAQLDAEYGFRDLRFGQPPTPDMRLYHSDDIGRETYFRCASCPANASMAETLQECQRNAKQCALLGGTITTIGSARVMVYYKCYKNQLTGVEILALSEDDNQPLLTALRYEYGSGVRREADEEQKDNWEWWSGEYVKMSYLEPVSDGTAIVWITSKLLPDP